MPRKDRARSPRSASRSSPASSGLGPVSDDVAQVAARRVVEVPAAGDEAQGGVRDRPVYGLERELGFEVEPDRGDTEDGDRVVGAHDEGPVTWPQFLQAGEDSLPVIGIDVSGDDRWPDRTRPRALVVPAGHLGGSRHGHRPASGKAEPDQPGAHADTRNDQVHRTWYLRLPGWIGHGGDPPVGHGDVRNRAELVLCVVVAPRGRADCGHSREHHQQAGQRSDDPARWPTRRCRVPSLHPACWRRLLRRLTRPTAASSKPAEITAAQGSSEGPAVAVATLPKPVAGAVVGSVLAPTASVRSTSFRRPGPSSTTRVWIVPERRAT